MKLSNDLFHRTNLFFFFFEITIILRMRFPESFILLCSNFLRIFNILHSWHTIENFIQEKLEYLTSLYAKRMENDNDDLKFSIDTRDTRRPSYKWFLFRSYASTALPPWKSLSPTKRQLSPDGNNIARSWKRYMFRWLERKLTTKYETRIETLDPTVGSFIYFVSNTDN